MDAQSTEFKTVEIIPAVFARSVWRIIGHRTSSGQLRSNREETKGQTESLKLTEKVIASLNGPSLPGWGNIRFKLACALEKQERI